MSLADKLNPDVDASLEEKLHDLESTQRATFNILEDISEERERHTALQQATFNILEDFSNERERLNDVQRATLNLLDDFAEEKNRLENNQSATFNILDDFAAEKQRLEDNQKATFNILDDFVSERQKLNDLQLASFNILEDLNSEREKLKEEVRDRQRAEQALERTNREMEAFSYSVSHDLRGPLRGIDGFSQALLTEYGDKLNDEGREYLEIVRRSTQEMGQLIDDLLNLSRMTRSEVFKTRFDLSAVATGIVAVLRRTDPDRQVKVKIEKRVEIFADQRLMKVVLENLLGNAWKFTAKTAGAEIEFGTEGEKTLFVRDNGAGFDMAYSDKLFGAFQRLHSTDEFPGTGIGLATVRRILQKHGGDIAAESAVGRGATFRFTVAP